MTAEFPLWSKTRAIIISAYTPTMTNTEQVKDKFYEELVSLIASIRTDKVILFGDFNAQVGTDYHTWQNTIEKHGVAKGNAMDTS